MKAARFSGNCVAWDSVRLRVERWTTMAPEKNRKGVAVPAHDVELGKNLGKLCLPALPAAPKIARDLVNAVVRAAGVDEDVAYRARVATSELVTNALCHGIPGNDVGIGISRIGDLLHISVADTSPDIPQLRHPQGLAEGGYGLLLVGDITDDCGFHFTALGKEVWFSLKAEWLADAAELSPPVAEGWKTG